MLLELHAVITGRVQGVGFRATVRSLARGLGITGSAENLPDGTVEIYAQGSQEQLEQFLSSIKTRFAVQSIDQNYVTISSIKSGFEIK